LKEGEALKIGCVQSRALDVSRWKEALDRALVLADEAVAGGAELVLMPEALFPAYYLGGEDPAASWREADPRPVFSGYAANRRIHLAAGLVLEEGGALFNGAVLWGPDGGELLRTFKSNLWHFDGRYVLPGSSFPVADTEFGRVGMMVCADGRIPEISRILALKGARLILDLTNLTSTGRNKDTLSNPQLEYMLPARAAENGVWIAVADKVGLEAETVLNCGGSRLIDPLGNVVASLDSSAEGVLVAEADLEAPRPPMPGRTPKLYSILTADTVFTGAYLAQFDPLTSAGDEVFAALCRFTAAGREEFLEKASHFLVRAADQGNRLVCLPFMEEEGCSGVAEKLSCLLAGSDVIAVLSGPAREGRETVVFSADGVIGRFSGEMFEPLDTPVGRIGAVFGDEGWNPEPVRCFMLGGAEVAVWYGDGTRPRETSVKIARTRAAENRIFLLYFHGGDDVLVAGPSGAVLAEALDGGDQAVSAMIRRSESRGKTVVPGTNIVSGRLPSAYGDLVADEGYSGSP
jgi:predicted amidohydrolase